MNNHLARLIGLSVVTFAAGCAASEPQSFAAGDVGFALASQAKDQSLEESLFKDDQAVIGNDELQRILSAKVTLPDGARVAVVRFGRRPYWWGWSDEFVRTTQKIDADFLGKLRACPRLSRVSYLPALVTPPHMTIPHLRQAAARFQADLLLIYQTSSQSYSRQKVFTRDKTKAYCTVEAVLLDTRTGTIPWSTVATRDFVAERTSAEVAFAETVAKAESAAIGKAWLEVADEAVAFLNELPR